MGAEIAITRLEHTAADLRQQARRGVGHSVRHFSPCAQLIMAAFIDAPDGVLDTACAARGSAFETAPR